MPELRFRWISWYLRWRVFQEILDLAKQLGRCLLKQGYALIADWAALHRPLWSGDGEQNGCRRVPVLSALQLYNPVFMKLTAPHGPEGVIRIFIAHDQSGKFQLALSEWLLDHGVKQELDACKEGKSCNVPLFPPLSGAFLPTTIWLSMQKACASKICVLSAMLSQLSTLHLFTATLLIGSMPNASVLGYMPRAETSAAVDGDLSALDPEATNVAA